MDFKRAHLSKDKLRQTSMNKKDVQKEAATYTHVYTVERGSPLLRVRERSENTSFNRDMYLVRTRRSTGRESRRTQGTRVHRRWAKQVYTCRVSLFRLAIARLNTFLNCKHQHTSKCTVEDNLRTTTTLRQRDGFSERAVYQR